MKKKLLSILIAVFILLPCLLLTGCIRMDTSSEVDFRVEDGYVQCTTDGKEWQNLIATEDLKGEQGLQGTPGDDADVWTIGNDGYWYRNGNKTNNKATGDVGAAGNGIKSIAPSTDPTKTNTSQTTYIITLDDNSTYEFVVKNGEKGETGDPGKDTTYSTYTITYDYGVASSSFNEVKANDTVKSTEWLVGLPEIKPDYANGFKGWFIAGTEKQIEDYDFIGGNVALEARFDISKNVQSGLYKNGKYIKTWTDLREYYPDEAISDNSINYNKHGYSYFMGVNGYDALEGELVIDDSITEIETYALSSCTKLTAVYLPKNITQVNGHMFRTCSELLNIYINPNNEYYTSENGVLYNKDKTDLVAYPRNKDIVFLDGITAIKDAVFAERNDLTTIEIPTSVKALGKSVFLRCENLSQIYLHQNITDIGWQCFLGCTALNIVIIDSADVANGLITDVNNIFSDCLLENATVVFIKSGLETKDSVYLLANFTKQATSDKDGYDMYVKNVA